MTMDVSVPAVERVRPPRAVVLFGNPVMRLLLRSPLHRLVSGALLLLHFRGRRTGRAYTVPVGYHRIDGQLGVLTNSGWRVNLRGGAGIEVTYRGRRHPARATLVEDPEVVAGVYERLIGHLGVERAQRRLGIRINVDRVPTRAELAEAVRRSGLSILRLDLPPAAAAP
jgi:hypothetical protein